MTPNADTPSPSAASRSLSVCVYCGSKTGEPAAHDYMALARDLGAALAGADLRLVYGAGDRGLMGAVSESCAKAGGRTLGVIPEGMFERELSQRGLPNVVVTENLHQRKATMLANSDAAIVLPGGVGTLDEFIEAATWRHLGLHAKPIILLDPADYWEPLLDMFAAMAANGFLWSDFAPPADAPADGSAAFSIAKSPDEAIARIRRALSATMPG
ncbi:MAG: TIGR00730 family Rossman fold protein [Neomegalonema sp.]|nr:TIGR00730 family Rossman fold protein [Neomegalonema sp.]